MMMAILLLVSLVVLKKKLEPRLLYMNPKTWILLVPWHYCRKKWKCLIRSTNSKLRIRGLANLVAGVSLPVTKPNLLTRKKM
uniref:Secreted protein n=1 Tax=Setaria viridis TaxID=4556 RepID=A0A4U6UYT7_SETVI|nr:hypothetical protein SEVIR_4G148401v2 [Setaria viridis]